MPAKILNCSGIDTNVRSFVHILCKGFCKLIHKSFCYSAISYKSDNGNEIHESLTLDKSLIYMF